MHIKSAVILSAVYLFTSVWSAGLNRRQIDKCIKLYNVREKLELKKLIPNIMKNEFGIENPENSFLLDSNEPHDLYFKNLFLVLAYKGTIDNFELPTLMPFEMELYLEAFNRYVKIFEQQEYLDGKQILDVIEYLKINTKEKTIAKKIECLFQDGWVLHNAVDFLSIMLNILPDGYGLNQAQIDEFIRLYETASDRIHCMTIKIFAELGMATDSYEDTMLMRSNRPAAIELMELMIVMAEHSKTVHENEVVLSTQEVRTLITGIKNLDTDNDGLLSDDDAKMFVEGFFANNPQVSKPDNFDDHFSKLPPFLSILKQKKNVAQILLICLMYKKNVSP